MKYDPPPPVVDCGDPGIVPNSNQTGPSTFLYGDTFSYTCHPGYEHTGTATTRTCLADGTWGIDSINCSGLPYFHYVTVQYYHKNAIMGTLNDTIDLPLYHIRYCKGMERFTCFGFWH